MSVLWVWARTHGHWFLLLALALTGWGLIRRHDRLVRESAILQVRVDSLRAVVDSASRIDSVRVSQIRQRDDSIQALSHANQALTQHIRLATASARQGVSQITPLISDSAQRLLGALVASYEGALAAADTIHQTDSRIIAFQRVTIAQQDSTIQTTKAQLAQALRLNEIAMKRGRPSLLSRVVIIAATVGGCSLVKAPC